ncbi:hypothetical protein ACET3X_008291 [Alternaria dauci]|uniref:Uncharacterized protein n=1 Tax=Alternaria dauci TaxID=48095 RepID=A0ABR3UCE7_9PLEO
MAPTRAPKKPTSITTSTATIRQGAQQAQRQVIDKTEELENSGEANGVGHDEDMTHEEAEASQNTPDGPLEHLMVKMVDDQRKRHDTSKKNIRRAYDNHYKSVEDSVNNMFDTHMREVTAAHQAQLKRLQELFDRKAAIETAMRRQLTSLQKIYDAHSRDLEAVIDRRLREMN